MANEVPADDRPVTPEDAKRAAKRAKRNRGDRKRRALNRGHAYLNGETSFRGPAPKGP